MAMDLQGSERVTLAGQGFPSPLEPPMKRTNRKPPWVQTRIVRASRALDSTCKLVWLEHYGLWNGGRGAYASASTIGHRLGVARSTIERMRRELRNYNLLVKRDHGNGRTDSWFTQLPTHCRPNGTRLSDDEVLRYAEMLDAHIQSRVASLTVSGGRGSDDLGERRAHLSPEGGFRSGPSGNGRWSDPPPAREVLPPV